MFHGVAVAGGTVTTINPTYGAEEVRFQLNDSGAKLLVTLPDFLPTAVEAIEGTSVTEVAVIGEADGQLTLADLMGEPIEQVPVDPATHVVVLPYSSGTTGLPKGVMLTHTQSGRQPRVQCSPECTSTVRRRTRSRLRCCPSSTSTGCRS